MTVPRWAACGWGLLTLAGLYAVVQPYRRLLEPASADVFTRLLLVGMGLAATSVAGSLLPRRPRAAIAIGLILSFTIVGGLGTLIATLCQLLQRQLGWQFDSEPIFVFSMEMALAGGVVLGAIIAFADWKGLIVIQFNSPSATAPIQKKN